MNNALAKYMCK